VAFVDTPGFGQSGRSDRDVVTDVIAWVKENLGGEKGFTAVVDLQSIDTDATYRSAFGNLDKFVDLAGGHSKFHGLIASTHWDVAQPILRIPRETRLKAGRWKSLVDIGAEPDHIYNNYRSSYQMLEAVLIAQREYTRSVELAEEAVANIGLGHMLATMQGRIDRIEQLEQRLGESEASNAALRSQIEEIQLQLGRQLERQILATEAAQPPRPATWTQTVWNSLSWIELVRLDMWSRLLESQGWNLKKLRRRGMDLEGMISYLELFSVLERVDLL
jgi:hypothetical protein